MSNPAVPSTAEGVVLAGIARALVQHQQLRPDQAVAIQKRADAAGRGRFIDELVASGALDARRLAAPDGTILGWLAYPAC